MFANAFKDKTFGFILNSKCVKRLIHSLKSNKNFVNFKPILNMKI